MKNTVLMGRGAEMVEQPVSGWLAEVEAAPPHITKRLEFMTPDHHRVRYFVVETLVTGNGQPLAPALIAERLELPLGRVTRMLDELESKLFFLVRNEKGEVSWAFPVTSDVTPHHLTFRSGERLYAA